MKKHTLGTAVALCLISAVAVTGRVVTVGGKAPVPHGDLPDLIVRQDVLLHHWVVRVEDLPASFCSVVEGEIEPGEHSLVRFTVTTPNIGSADIFVGDPNEHVAINDGLFEFASCHNHYHFRHYALYQLIDPGSGFVWRAAKRGFCMLDTDPNPQWLPGPVPGPGQYRNCGAVGIAGNQGISAGWSDTYNLHLGGQYFVLDGGDHQPPVPPGEYIIRITVNPPFVPQSGEPCPHLDSAGLCHQLPESDYTNNVGEVTITIPDRPGRTGVGPERGAPHLSSEPIDR
jgi:lysyl oxidase